MPDAATRFYQASHERNLLGTAEAPTREAIEDPAHRYYAAYTTLKRRTPDRVLELGYGTAGTVRAIAELGPFEYHVVDIVDRFEGVRLPANVKPIIHNLDDDFPFPAATFDAVIALMVVEHLYDPFHAMREIARVMKPGAVLVLNLPNIASLKCRLQLLSGKMPVTSSRDWFEKREWDGNHLHYFTVADVRRLAQVVGLELIEMLPVGKSRSLKAVSPELFCHEITYVIGKPGGI